MSNQRRCYWNEYQNALASFHSGEVATAEDHCLELIADFECPRLVQVQAWQLKANCTQDYWTARTDLEAALRLFEQLNVEDKVVRHTFDHTKLMLDDINTQWNAYYASRVETPPTQQQALENNLREAADEANEQKIGQQMQELDIQDNAEDERIVIDSTAKQAKPKPHANVGGHSSPFPEMPGGTERPWVALTAEQRDYGMLSPFPEGEDKTDSEEGAMSLS